MARRNFWQCDPKKAIDGCVDLSAEEIGVYFILINLMYQDWEPLKWHTAGAQRQVLRAFQDSAQKVRAIINRLIACERILLVEIGGRTCLIDERFAEECERYTGQPNPLKPAKMAPETAQEIDTKSGDSSGIGESESSHSASENPDYGPNSSMNSNADAHRREKEEEKKKIKNKKPRAASKQGAGNGQNRDGPEPSLAARWIGNPDLRKAVVDHHGEGFAVSYLDKAMPYKGGVRTRTVYAYDILRNSPAMKGVRVVPPP